MRSVSNILFSAAISKCIVLHPVPASANDATAVVWASKQCDEQRGDVAQAGILSSLLSLFIPKVAEAGTKGLGEALRKAGASKDRHAFGVQHVNALYRFSVVEGGSIPLPGATSANLSQLGDDGNADNGRSSAPARAAIESAPATARPLTVASDPATGQTAGTQPGNQTVRTGRTADSLVLNLNYDCVAVAFGKPKEGANAQALSMLTASLQAKDGVYPLDSRVEETAMNAKARVEVAKYFDMNSLTFMVVSFLRSPDGTAVKLLPRFFSSTGPVGKRHKKRSLNFTYSMSPPSGKPGADAPYTRMITIPSFAQKDAKQAPDMASLTTSWMPMPGLPSDVSSRVTTAKTRMKDIRSTKALIALESDEAKIAELEAKIADLAAFLEADIEYLRQVSPYTIRVDVNELQNGNRFLAKIGEFLADNASEISTEIAKPFDREALATAEENELQAAETLRITVITQAAALAKAKAEGDTAAERIALIKRDAACRQLEAAGFSEVDCLI